MFFAAAGSSAIQNLCVSCCNIAIALITESVLSVNAVNNNDGHFSSLLVVEHGTRTGRAFSRVQALALLSVRECHVQAGREHELVLFFSCGRVGDVGVAKIILPSEPLADLRERAQTEVRPVVAPAVRQVWEKREILQ